MIHRERRVKGLDAESAGILLPSSGGHERDGAKAADVAVMEVATIVEGEMQGGVRRFGRRKRSAAQKKGTGESGLDDDSLAGVQVNDDQLCAAPAAYHRGASDARGQIGSGNFAQHVRPDDACPRDASAPDLAIEVAGDGLGFGELGHGEPGGREVGEGGEVGESGSRGAGTASRCQPPTPSIADFLDRAISRQPMSVRNWQPAKRTRRA